MENLRHRALRISGRDPDETHRAATTLELLFDAPGDGMSLNQVDLEDCPVLMMTRPVA